MIMNDLVKYDPVEIEKLKLLVLDSVPAKQSKRAYETGLESFFLWWFEQGRPTFSKAVVQSYKTYLVDRKLAPSTINLRLATLRRLAAEASDNGLLSPETAAAIGRVKGIKKLGVRAGNWLTLEQAKMLLGIPDRERMLGLRDRAAIALLVGCALRRSEVVHLKVEDIQQRDGRWVIPDLVGKGGRLRTVAVPAWVKVILDEWTAAAKIRSGPALWSITKYDTLIRAKLSVGGVWNILERCWKQAGLPKITPHDLRRTCAKLSYQAGGDIEQIQFLLGHSDIKTTQIYLGGRQNLKLAPNDLIQM